MAQPPDDPVLIAFQFTLFSGSLLVWIWIVSQWLRGRRLLELEPRRVVPWGPIAALPAVSLVLLGLLSGLAGDGLPPEEFAPDAFEAARHLWAAIALQLFVAGLAIAVAAYFNATTEDLGVSVRPIRLLRDFFIGGITCLAAVLPVYGLQGLLLYLIGQDDPSHHPLVKMVTAGEPNLGVLVLATISAVLIAPIGEEIVFRLMLQGWLEKWEQEQLSGGPSLELLVSNDNQAIGLEQPRNDELRMTNDEKTDHDNSSFVIRHSSFPSRGAPSRGLAGLRFGLLPILVSSLLFAAAHFGYGPEPVPIFVLALVLGYVYQRTHRIIPCMVAHAMFNSITILVLWRMVFHAAE